MTFPKATEPAKGSAQRYADVAMETTGTKQTALVLVCRRPAPGVGKRRLAEALGDAATTKGGQLLLNCAVADAEGWPGPVVVAPANRLDAEWAGGLLARESDVVPQQSGNLGERIAALHSTLHQRGQTECLYIGSDAPALDVEYLESAALALRQTDVVLGPAEDGGVTLMGTRQLWPDLAPLDWGTDKLGEQLERACRLAGLSVTLLEQRFDVDLPADLLRLQLELRDDPRPSRRALMGWIEQLNLEDRSPA